MSRTAVATLTALLVACGGRPDARPPVEAVDGGTGGAHTLLVPARLERTYRHDWALLRGRADAGLAGTHAVSFALGSGFPDEPVLTFPQVLGTLTNTTPLRTRWTQLTVEGDALTAQLSAEGDVQTRLLREGAARLVLGGVGQPEDEREPPADVPLTLSVDVTVRHVASYVVRSFSQVLGGCPTRAVFPANGVWLPVAIPRDGTGREFTVANASSPLPLELISTGPLGALSGQVLEIAAGHVDVRAQTSAPVDGLKSFEVIDSEDLTQATVTAHVVRAAAKGSISEPVTTGASYRLFFPEQPNTVELRVSDAQSRLGAVCGVVPAAWFLPVSETPSVCEAKPGGAVLRGVGECRLTLQAPGVAPGWSARFVVE